MAVVQKCAQRIVYTEPIALTAPINDLAMRANRVYADRTETAYDSMDLSGRDVEDLTQLLDQVDEANRALDERIESYEEELKVQEDLQTQVAEIRQGTANIRSKRKQMHRQIKSQQQRLVESSAQDLIPRVETFKQGVRCYNQSVDILTTKSNKVYQEADEMCKEATKFRQAATKICASYIKLNQEIEELDKGINDLGTFYTNTTKEVEYLIALADQRIYKRKVDAFVKKGEAYIQCLQKREQEDYNKYLVEIEAFMPSANEQDRALLNKIKSKIEKKLKDDRAILDKIEKTMDVAFSILTLSFIFTIFQDTLPKLTHYLCTRSTSTHCYKKIEV